MAAVLRDCVLALTLLHVVRAAVLAGPKAGGCDFENGMCGYTNQSDNANHSWERYQAGFLPHIPTDHTYLCEEGKGHYAVFHWDDPSDSSFENPWLISPALDVDEDGVCLEFWYRVPKRGSLALKILNDGVTDQIFHWDALGYDEDIPLWLKGQVHVQNYMSFSYTPEPIPNKVASIQFVFEGIKYSGSHFGSVALDDITTSIGSCPTRPGDCDFSKNKCTWDNSGEQKWSRKTNYGGFMKFQRVASKSHDQEVTLVSETMTGSQCLRFEYKRVRNVIGELSIYLRFPNAGNRTETLWTLSGQGHNGLGMLPLLLNGNEEEYQVVFSVAPYSGGRVELGIDTISFIDYDSKTCMFFPEFATPGYSTPTLL